MKVYDLGDKEDPPCFLCKERRSSHIQEKCPFAATSFALPSDTELIWFAMTGNFIHEDPPQKKKDP